MEKRTLGNGTNVDKHYTPSGASGQKKSTSKNKTKHRNKTNYGRHQSY